MAEKNWQIKKESNLEKKHNPNRKRAISITITHEAYQAIQNDRRRLETVSTTIERLVRAALNLPQ